MLIHCSATKRYLVNALASHHFTGAPSPLKLNEDFDWCDAIIAVASDPRENFVLGECDNQLPDGSCGGHTSGAPVIGGDK